MVKAFSNIILALVFLVTTSGLNISTHICMGEVYSFAFFKSAKSCCNDVNHQHANCKNAVSKHHCQNKSVNIKLTNDYCAANDNINFTNTHFIQLFIDKFIIINNNIDLNKPANILAFKDKSPPLSNHSLSLFQSFLL